MFNCCSLVHSLYTNHFMAMGLVSNMELQNIFCIAAVVSSQWTVECRPVFVKRRHIGAVGSVVLHSSEVYCSQMQKSCWCWLSYSITPRLVLKAGAQPNLLNYQVISGEIAIHAIIWIALMWCEIYDVHFIGAFIGVCGSGPRQKYD